MMEAVIGWGGGRGRWCDCEEVGMEGGIGERERRQV